MKLCTTREAIIGGTGASQESTEAAIRTLAVKNKIKYESRPHGTTPVPYFSSHKTVSVEQLAVELEPIIKILKEAGKKHVAAASLQTVAHQALLLQKLLDKWLDKKAKPDPKRPLLGIEIKSWLFRRPHLDAAHEAIGSL